MKKQPKTVIQTLAERLREQAKRFDPSIEMAPQTRESTLVAA